MTRTPPFLQLRADFPEVGFTLIRSTLRESGLPIVTLTAKAGDDRFAVHLAARSVSEACSLMRQELGR